MLIKSLIKQLYTAIDSNIQSETIKRKPHSDEILKHSKHYSNLLDAYVDSTRENITMKKWFKIFFFIITMGSLVAVVYFFYDTLQYAFNSFDKYSDSDGITTQTILSAITVLIPSISSLIVAFIKIPEIIARYLFNTKEDEYMNLIIKNIQDYDRSMFAMEQKIDELLMDHKDQNEDVADDSIDDPPTIDVG